MGITWPVATSWDPSRTEEVLNGVRIVPFRIMGNSVRSMRGEVGRYQEWLRRESFDVILNYAAQAWPTDAAGVGAARELDGGLVVRGPKMMAATVKADAPGRTRAGAAGGERKGVPEALSGVGGFHRSV